MHALQVMSEPKRSRGRPVKGDEPTQQMTVRIPRSLHRALLQLSVELHPETISDFVNAALDTWWEPHPMRALVERKLACGVDPPPAPPPKARRKQGPK